MMLKEEGRPTREDIDRYGYDKGFIYGYYYFSLNTMKEKFFIIDLNFTLDMCELCRSDETTHIDDHPRLYTECQLLRHMKTQHEPHEWLSIVERQIHSSYQEREFTMLRYAKKK